MNIILKENIIDVIVTSHEAIDILGITRARLCQLNKAGKLIPVKKNLYYLKDIQERQNIQEDLRNKYFRPSKK